MLDRAPPFVDDIHAQLALSEDTANIEEVLWATVLAKGVLCKHTIAKPANTLVPSDSVEEVVRLATERRVDLDALVVHLHTAGTTDTVDNLVKLVHAKEHCREPLHHLIGKLLFLQRHLGARVRRIVQNGTRNRIPVDSTVVEVAMALFGPFRLADRPTDLIGVELLLEDILDDDKHKINAEGMELDVAEDRVVWRTVGAVVVPEDDLIVSAKRTRARRHHLVDREDDLVEEGLVIVQFVDRARDRLDHPFNYILLVLSAALSQFSAPNAVSAYSARPSPVTA